jgi:Carbohydrate binding domain
MSVLSGKKGRLAAAAVALLAPLGLVTVMAANTPAAAAVGFGVAPYVDMTNNQEPILSSAISTGGLKAFTAAFVISSGCTPIWGDTLPVTNDPTVNGEISSAEAAGAGLIVSFGGEGGVELAQGCTNQTSLTAAYQSVINTLHPSRIDFDIEGASIADPTSINLRFHAIAALESANPGLIVSVTIPVLPTGPDFNGDAFLQDAKADGARIDLVNIMTMDYGAGSDPAEMGNDAIQAAQDTLSFVKTVWPSDTFANIGITPMIGINDDANEDFTEADAHTLVNFANANGVGRLAFWSVDRDQPCAGTATGLPSCSEITQTKLDFTKIFTGFTGTGGGTAPPPPPPTSNPPTTPPPTTNPPPPPTAGNLISNPGFESGLAGWTCAATDSAVTTPVHTGTHSLAAAATNSDDAQCTQSVAVQANHTYTLSAWVQGNFAFIGDTGTGTTDTSTFTQGSAGFTQLTVTFTTGAATTHVTVFLHGWFAQGTIHADDVSLS